MRNNKEFISWIEVEMISIICKIKLWFYENYLFKIKKCSYKKNSKFEKIIKKKKKNQKMYSM